MAIKILSAALSGIEAEIIEIEATAGGGDFGQITIVGLPDTSVSEAKERVRSALLNGGLEFPKRKITVNLAPAEIRKSGPIYDLPIAISILSLKYKFNFDFSTCLIAGELSLTGEVRKIRGAVSMAIKARERGLKYLFLPFENAKETSLIKELLIFPVNTLRELIDHLNKKTLIIPCKSQVFYFKNKITIDFSDIKGQEKAKRALEIAIAGGHNILMSGPPGSGKTMLAKAAGGILPPLSEQERLEVSKIYSVANNSENVNSIQARPFRAPHHSASMAALIGGGTKFRPGEISLAHLGVLFLDEFPEFSRDALESLRQPLEEGEIVISRAAGNLKLPAKFILIAAMNPCPCGLNGMKGKECTCSQEKIKNYRRKISGPILDRIDLYIEVLNLNLMELDENVKRENSINIGERIKKARKIQAERLLTLSLSLNSFLTSKQIKKFCQINKAGEELIISAAKNLSFSNRSYFKILKIARTIADLDGKEIIEEKHLAEALQYRPRLE
ncbi:MAG: YifB family Mg chelatase-like AAA ATPase [Patescibacteria group bacterium]